jgi:hypothetical protein
MKIKTFLISTLFFLPNFVLAYVSLVPDSPLGSAASSLNLQEFLKKLYEWGVGIAVALSILFIIFGGIEYMTTDSVFKKDESKKRITAAVAGLLIVLSSYLILNQINPKIFTNDLSLDANLVDSAKSLTTGSSGNNSGSTTGGNIGGIPYGGAYNATQASVLGGNGIENLAQLKTDSNGIQYVGGKMSTFGGSNDTGVSAIETGAISGENLRSLNPNSYYIAGRWDYSKTSKADLKNKTVTVYNPTTGRSVSGVKIVDWGPNTNTGRTWDTSPGVANSVGASTDSEVWVKFDN